MTTAQNSDGFIPQWTVADRIRKVREVKGLKQAELADLIGFSRATLANVEQGARKPRRGELLAIAFATGVDLAWLESGKTPAEKPSGGGSVGPVGLEPTTCGLKGARQ